MSCTQDALFREPWPLLTLSSSLATDIRVWMDTRRQHQRQHIGANPRQDEPGSLGPALDWSLPLLQGLRTGVQTA